MLDNRQIAALAAAIYREARGESQKGKEAVAHTVYNRSQIAKVGLSDVVYGSYDKKFGQFSFANPQDPNAQTVRNAPSQDKKGWAEAVKLAEKIANGRENGTLADPTKGATHYHTTAVNPSWSKAYPKTTKIGPHQFYKAPANEVRGVVRKAAQSPYRRNDLVPADAVAGLVGKEPKGMAALAPNGLLAPQSAAYEPVDMTRPIQYSNAANRNAQPYEGMVVHHDAAENLQQIADITNYPRSNGHMKGYHYAIDRDGNVAQLAPLDQRVNHVGQNPPSGSAGHLTNSNSVAVVMLGAHEQQTPEQQAALQALTGNLKETGIDLNPTNIAYHGKGSTAANPVEGQEAANQLAGVLAPTPTSRPPVERSLLASLPVPEPAPERSLLSAFNPVSSAHAGEMPKGSLLQPAPRPTGEPASNTAHPYANATPMGTAEQPTSLLDLKGSMPSEVIRYNEPAVVYDDEGLRTEQKVSPIQMAVPNYSMPTHEPSEATPYTHVPAGMAEQYAMYGNRPAEPVGILDQYAQEFEAGILANPESMAREEITAQPVSLLPAPTQVAPAPIIAPVQAPSMLPTPQDPYTLQQQAYSPPPPQNSAMDVWRGDAQSGVDSTGAYELNRADNGNIYRYSSKHDRTDILNADGSYRGQKSGKIDGPVGGGEINTPSLGNPFGKAKTADGAYVRGILGATAGGMAGSFAGPVGGILGSLIGRNIAQGQGLLSLQGAVSKMTPGHSYRSQYNGPPITANTFPDVPNQAGVLTAHRSRNNSSLYDPNAGGLSAAEEAARRNSISPAAAAHVARGGSALF
ncbi:MAG: cell wall hydrolase [Pseudomonadota bacterium]